MRSFAAVLKPRAHGTGKTTAARVTWRPFLNVAEVALRRSCRTEVEVIEAGLPFVAPLATRPENRLVLRPDGQPCALPQGYL